MINNCKSNQISAPLQIAGLFPSDNSIEFVGNRETKRTLWMRGGHVSYFTDLPTAEYNLVKEAYLKLPKAVAFCSAIHKELKDQVELFTYYMFGDLDATPDIKDGVLAPSENFRDKRNCPSLHWETKQITIDTYILTPRDLLMIDMMADDYKDAVIAEAIGVCHSHYDALKRKLFTYTNTQSKPALLLKAKEQNVI
ncbi:LuxR family transcriptional regulator [Polaribacter phage Leef_1]|uniref:LuxR family transcriptional regulator n=1 Tax=Polaribacter phage Leef_1 TaxID=2745684 RepID=A0A8E4ZDR5_9CAUD|nr:LuxR family transcriptional regulator [Polaribacter phage Leef_1]QQV91386.1 LuxR family transcriptional regulator [Polaribacter phage Leef_1]